MKRSSHRSSNAPVLGLQSLKGFEGVGIADHARNLPTAGRIDGLALCAGFWLGHGLGRSSYELAKLCRNRIGALLQVRSQPKSKSFGAVVELARLAGGCLSGRFSPLDSVCAELGLKRIGVRLLSCDPESERSRFGGGQALHVADSYGRFGVHGWLRLVTVGPSYSVTSDKSTTVGREVLMRAA
jgi:hypothetical protein